MDPKDHKGVDRLSRVRDNQRKSRARKQEYVKELEQRLAACEEKAKQDDIKSRLITQKVEADNRHLKALLGKLGITPGFIEQYLQQASAAVVNGKIAIPAAQRPEDSPKSRPAAETQRVSGSPQTEKVAENTTESTDKAKQESTDPSFCGCQSEGQTTSDEDVLNSTLCAIAEEMINQYNTKGVDVEEIRQRIWSGFRAGVDGTGCRVQNHVLFQVLDDISH
ncbi:hypothetical protein N7452_000094 [Penicillium brevicompactum]|uniref:BZIP domain-containing protein n=1 Tax=Penicillium brevicompactum TaxID=5074 RepID=A0A9W9R1A8_PENBR|nr:hypothetical protein N7452_000094 [Penicillium brevicompactum]